MCYNKFSHFTPYQPNMPHHSAIAECEEETQALLIGKHTYIRIKPSLRSGTKHMWGEHIWGAQIWAYLHTQSTLLWAYLHMVVRRNDRWQVYFRPSEARASWYGGKNSEVSHRLLNIHKY